MMEESRHTILIVHNYYRIPGGEDTVVLNEKKLLEDRGHVVVFYSRRNDEIMGMSIAKKLLLPFLAIFNIRTYRDIKKIINDFHIQIVHVHNTLSLVSPSVYYAAVKCGVPVVQTIHNFRLLCPGATFYRDSQICEDCLNFGLKCAIRHKCYRNSKIQTMICTLSTWIHRHTGIIKKLNYITLTEFTRNMFLKSEFFEKSRIYVKQNYVQQPKSMKEMAGGRDCYLFVGRIEEIKGIKLLVDTFKELPQYKLDVIGTGTLEEEIKKKITEDKIDNIQMLGYVPHDEISKYIHRAKALIMCSQWYETFGMVIAEAYSCKTPVLVGRIGNIKDLVREGDTGYLFEYDSKEDLKRVIQKMEESDAEMMGEKAFEYYSKYLTEENNYRRLMKIYSSIITSNSKKVVE